MCRSLEQRGRHRRQSLRSLITQRYGTRRLWRELDIEGLVANDLKEAGYLHPRVTSQIESGRSGTHLVLAVSIVPGERTKVGSVELEGDPGMSLPQFLDALHLARGQPFQRRR
jgi:hypothetical protein